MGDDLPDLPVMTRLCFLGDAGRRPCAGTAPCCAHHRRHGGRGAVREACEFILDAQGKLAADAGTVSDDDRPMKKWSSALLPLTILLVLVALTAWLRYATEFPEVRNDGKNRHDPDYIISDVRGRKLDASGNLLYTLTADEIRHYPDDDTTDLLKPTLIYLDPKQPPVTIQLGAWAREFASRAGRALGAGRDTPCRDSAKERATGGHDVRVDGADRRGKGFHQEQGADHPGTNSWVQGVGMQVRQQVADLPAGIRGHRTNRKPFRQEETSDMNKIHCCAC
jgi:hypothetical protein